MSGVGQEQASRWIISRRADLAMLVLPLLITLAVLPHPHRDGDGPVPLWAFFGLVIACDVSHVWATLYLSYFDPLVRKRRPLLCLLPIPVTLLVSYRVHQESEVFFWTLVAYLAIHHFAAQQYGFIALYKLRAGEREPLDRYLDKWTLWVGALGPVLWWHTTTRAFDWFGHGEQFLVPLPPSLRTEIYLLMGAFACVYLLRQVQLASRGRFNWGKNMWMVASWASWSLGIGMADHPLVSLACINMLHGVPFLFLSWFRCHARWGPESKSETDSRVPQHWMGWLSKPRQLWLFLGVLVVLASLEEGLWDVCVWEADYVPLDPLDLTGEARSLVVALLATPQIVHYYLDAWLWKLDGSNPELNAALGVRKKSEGDMK